MYKVTHILYRHFHDKIKIVKREEGEWPYVQVDGVL